MSARTEQRERRAGVALLLAIVVTTLVGLCVLALWQGAAGATRAVARETAIIRAQSLTAAAAVRGIAAVDSGMWRATLQEPSAVVVIDSGTVVGGWSRTAIARVGWETLLVRASSEVASGTPDVPARADRRVVIPLQPPLDLPSAALTGRVPWELDLGALVDVPAPSSRESNCRAGVHPVAQRAGAFPVLPAELPLVVVNPDTVTMPITGAIRLSHGRIQRQLRVTGMVVLDSELVVQADLQVTGVLVVQRSVRPAGGRLEVTGAVVTGDAGGGHSGLGVGDRVRYDACAVRRAVERTTGPGPTAIWTVLELF